MGCAGQSTERDQCNEGRVQKRGRGGPEVVCPHQHLVRTTVTLYGATGDLGCPCRHRGLCPGLPTGARRHLQVLTDGHCPREVDDPVEVPEQPFGPSGLGSRSQDRTQAQGLAGAHGDALTVDRVEAAQGVTDRKQPLRPVGDAGVPVTAVAGLPVHRHLPHRSAAGKISESA
jgi:hypothetical protein